MYSKSDSSDRSATPTTAIPNSRGLAGDCGFAYPLLVYWNRSLSVAPFSPLFLSIRKIIPSPFPSRLLSSSSSSLRPLSPYTFRRSFFDSILSTKRTRLAALRDFISLSSVWYLPISISPLLSTALSAERADPRPRTQSPPVPGFYYEIRDSPPPPPRPRVQVHPYLLSPYTFSGRAAVAIYIGKLCECRITPDYASPTIPFFSYTLAPRYACCYHLHFYHDVNLTRIYSLSDRNFF